MKANGWPWRRVAVLDDFVFGLWRVCVRGYVWKGSSRNRLLRIE